MNEQWKDIPGYEGLYQASNTGLIRTVNGKTTSNARFSERHWKMIILKPKARKRSNGSYDPRVELWKDGAHKTFLVSRLVAMTWCNGYREELTVNHKDGDVLNNTPDNLEWVTLADNIRHGYATGLYKNAQRKCVLKDEKQEYVFPSQYAASKFLCQGKRYINNRLIHNKSNAFSKEGKEYELRSF